MRLHIAQHILWKGHACVSYSLAFMAKFIVFPGKYLMNDGSFIRKASTLQLSCQDDSAIGERTLSRYPLPAA